MAEPLPFAVEPMTVSDIGQVMEIERVVFSAPWSSRAYRYEISENEHSTMLVVRPVHRFPSKALRLRHYLRMAKPGPLLGYGGFWLLVDQAHISTIAVHPDWQKRGLGELLLISLLDQSVTQGALSATLEVRVSNHAAQGLYNKHQFMVVSRRKRYYADNNEDALLMTTPRLDSPEFQTNLRHRRRQLLTRLQMQSTGRAGQIGMVATPSETDDGGHPPAKKRSS